MIGKPGRPSKCRACGKPIAFIKTVNGKSIPVDPEPISFIPEDNYNKFVMMDGTVKRGREYDGDELDAQIYLTVGYRSHFATCPAADSFRKKNKSERKKEDKTCTAL